MADPLFILGAPERPKKWSDGRGEPCGKVFENSTLTLENQRLKKIKFAWQATSVFEFEVFLLC